MRKIIFMVALTTLLTMPVATTSAETSNDAIVVANVIFQASLLRDQEIDIDAVSAINSMTFETFEKSGTKVFDYNSVEFDECTQILKRKRDALIALISCANPTRIMWKFAYQTIYEDSLFYEVRLSILDAAIIRRKATGEVSGKRSLPYKYVSIWNDNEIVRCDRSTDFGKCSMKFIRSANTLLQRYSSSY